MGTVTAQCQAGGVGVTGDLASAFDNAPVGVAVVTPVGSIVRCNAALGRLLGRLPQELVGSTLFGVTHPEDLPEAYAQCAKMQAGAARVITHECRFISPQGDQTWVRVTTSRVLETPGHEAHLIMHVEDVSERKLLEAELRHRSWHDSLTGLPNRTLLLDRVRHAVELQQRAAGCTSLFFLDLNEFKSVNDMHGHAAGDEVLREFGARLTALLRPGDTAARLGGDEFVVLCENTDAQQAAVIGDRLRSAAATPFTIAGGQVFLTAAVGLTVYDSQGAASAAGPDPESLLRWADRDMYSAKRVRRASLGAPGRSELARGEAGTHAAAEAVLGR